MPAILGATEERRTGSLIRSAKPREHHRRSERAARQALSATRASADAKAAAFVHSWNVIGGTRSGNPLQDLGGLARADAPPACVPNGFALPGVVPREFRLPSRAGKRSPKREQHDPVHVVRAESATQ